MNDDFLNQFREPPRSEFAASLYKRISGMHTQPNVFFRHRLAWTSSVLVVMLTITLAFSPSARALAADLLRQIGVLTLDSRAYYICSDAICL